MAPLRSILVASILTTFALTGASHADQEVQEGSLSGGGGPMWQDIFIEQFDTQGETRALNFVQLDFLTSVIGGGTSNGSGVPTHVFASLTADYYLGDDQLAFTQAIIDYVVPNTGPPGGFTLFDTDTAQVLIDDDASMMPWIGRGQIVLSAFTELIVTEDPPGSVGFGAGGSVHYSVTYDFDLVPSPGGLALLALCAWRRRRRRSVD
jgi:hypothetical protein